MSDHTLHLGDCLDVMRIMPDCSVDAVVTDPPYGLSFMGKAWDYDVPSVDVWREALRVLKPGGHLLAFAGTRTQHRMAVAIEDAGFEIRDMIMWCYGAGFPKSHNISKALGDSVCLCRGSALPCTHEKEVPREPQAERAVHPVRNADVSQAVDLGERRGQILQQSLSEQGAPFDWTLPLQGNEGRSESCLEGRRDSVQEEGQLHGRDLRQSTRVGKADGSQGRLRDAAPSSDGGNVRLPVDQNGSGQSQGSQSQQQRSVQPGAVSHERGSQEGGSWPICGGCGKPMVPEGFGTALKPALEPITVARKPLVGTVAKNVLRYGTGAINIDGCRVHGLDALAGRKRHGGGIAENHSSFVLPDSDHESPAGRWPANLIHDGSGEVVGLFPEVRRQVGMKKNAGGFRFIAGDTDSKQSFTQGSLDSGSAARFFYTAKASRADREDGNTHPTVKPTDLMRYLCRLVTPPCGIVLDPFMGSGSTGKAAMLEGFEFIGIERDADSYATAERRINRAAAMGHQPSLL